LAPSGIIWLKVPDKQSSEPYNNEVFWHHLGIIPVPFGPQWQSFAHIAASLPVAPLFSTFNISAKEIFTVLKQTAISLPGYPFSTWR